MVNRKSVTAGELPPEYDGQPASQTQSHTAENETTDEKCQPEDTELPALSPNDIVIAVMGVTGSGKTTFVSYFAPKARVGHGLESCTSTVGIHKVTIGQGTVYLIDTPGFDDTHRSDTDILRELANWLNSAYKSKIKLSGIIYLHRIVDNRMSGSAMKNLRMFKRLCGEEALSCVVLATTMWSFVSPEDGAKREHELMTKPEFWASMVERGSKVLRHDNGAVAAMEIMRYIMSQRRRIDLDIQKEMASGKTLGETSAGREVQSDMEAIKRKYEAEMANLRQEMDEARRDHDVRAQKEIAAVRAELEEKLRKDRKDRDKMRVTMEELRQQRTEELAIERAAAHEREMQWSKEMFQAQAQIAREKAANQANAAMSELKLQLAMKEADNKRLEREAAERRERDEGGGCVVM
ncbi:P-loop containing nucleoside triphosphate hydrolase protein [Chaetomidium leptoderma]|uniref:P-loop containing nucleoside triphosphate hydrolase protein n=1 Tax=Chaetomidium leptoderma TaxID=669021 RepID=A0AAN6ZYR0_9PEZI|nr:P-loop containing nucleoside triphosphate hydrolase protein [Chaetomidium leptoderma]